jgi:hypothetical protein
MLLEMHMIFRMETGMHGGVSQQELLMHGLDASDSG